MEGGALRDRVNALEVEVQSLRRDVNALRAAMRQRGGEAPIVAVDARSSMTGLGDRGPPRKPQKPPMDSVPAPPIKRKSTAMDQRAVAAAAAKRPSLNPDVRGSSSSSSSSSSGSGSSSSESSDSESEEEEREGREEERAEEPVVPEDPAERTAYVRRMVEKLTRSVQEYEQAREDRSVNALAMPLRRPQDYKRLGGGGLLARTPSRLSQPDRGGGGASSSSSSRPSTSSGGSGSSKSLPSMTAMSGGEPRAGSSSMSRDKKSKSQKKDKPRARPLPDDDDDDDDEDRALTPLATAAAAAAAVVSDEEEQAYMDYARTAGQEEDSADYDQAPDEPQEPFPEGMSNGVQMANVVPLTVMYLCETSNPLKHTLRARKPPGNDDTYLVVSNTCPSGCQMTNMLLNFKALEYLVSRLTVENMLDRANRPRIRSLDSAQRLMTIETYEDDGVPSKYSGYDKVFQVKDLRRNLASTVYLTMAVSQMGQAVFFNHEGSQLFEVSVFVLVPVLARLLLAHLFPTTTVYTHDPFAVARDWYTMGNCTLYNPFTPHRIRGRDTQIFAERIMPEQEVLRIYINDNKNDWWNFSDPTPVAPVRDPRYPLDTVPYADEARAYRDAVLEPYTAR